MPGKKVKEPERLLLNSCKVAKQCKETYMSCERLAPEQIAAMMEQKRGGSTGSQRF